MTDCYIRGTIINTKNTAAGLSVDISSGASGLKGTVSGTVQFFQNGRLNKFRFSSTKPGSFKIKEENKNKVTVTFNKVALEDLINLSKSDISKIEITAVRADSNTWAGNFHITSPDGRSLMIKGVFDGHVSLIDPNSMKTSTPQISIQKGASARQKKRLIPLIIQLAPEIQTSVQTIKQHTKTLVCKAKHHYPMINAFSTKVDGNKLRSLLEDSKVYTIWYDKKVKALLDVSTPVVQAPPVWRSGFTGRGVGIAILDTGIYPHPDLVTPRRRLIAFKDFVNNRAISYDDNGHGTHVAGDAAGNGIRSRGLFRGPAPEAHLIGIKVLDKYGSGYLSDVLAGIQWAINFKNRFNIRVMNLSLGTEATQSSLFDPLCQAVRKAWAAGIVVCAAAGNSGPGLGTIDSPGIEPAIITVGADNTRRTISIADDFVASFSSRGPTIDRVIKPDVIAPGVNIRSLRSPGSYEDVNYPRLRVGNWYFILSGTSMSTPICSGVAALLIQKNPRITPNALKQALKSTARKIGRYPAVAQGSGLIDAR